MTARELYGGWVRIATKIAVTGTRALSREKSRCEVATPPHHLTLNKSLAGNATFTKYLTKVSGWEKPVKSNQRIRCLAGEPKHIPFATVFVFIIKITLTCTRGFT